ncbi:MAG: hypothetical protein U1F15_04345 [Burkholderiales bacterium]
MTVCAIEFEPLSEQRRPGRTSVMLTSKLRTVFSVMADRLGLLCAILGAAAQVVAGPAHAVDLLNGDEDFKVLATLGFEQAVDGAHAQGSYKNDYAWSMAWFKGKLYVGTGRLAVDPATGQPGAAQIWAYTPGGADGASGTWALAFQSPNFVIGGGPREFGYRWMTSCTFNGTEYLFISTIGTLQGNILYTSDGTNFSPVSRNGIPFQSVGFRTTVCWTEASGKRMLITSPVGKAGDATTFDSDLSDNPVALANDNPAGGGGWRNYSPMRMGDPDNNSYFSMAAADGWLYAGVSNLVTGAQLWRTRGCSSQRSNCVPDWIKLIDRGGGRPLNGAGVVGNQGFSDIVAYGGALYMGLSAPAIHLDYTRAELWRKRADDTFEILMGEPRLNFGSNPNAPPTNPAFPSTLRCGLPLEDIDGVGGANDCPPTSRRGAGFGIVSNAAGKYPLGSQFYVWRLFNYAYHATNAPLGDNRLYVGTLQGLGDPPNAPGFDILATTDGIDYATISDGGLGNPHQQGMRSIAATPYGLGVGGTHFEVGYAGEVYGCNVWLGIPQPDTVAPVTTIASPPSLDEGATINVRTTTFSWNGADLPDPGSLPLTYATRLAPLEGAFSSFGSAKTKTYSALPDGTYTFFVIAKDNNGNVEAAGAAPGAGNRRTFTVSAPDLPPTVTITLAPGSPSAANVNFAWTGSDDLTPAASLVYDSWLTPLEADPGTFAAGTSRSYGNLVDGPYTFHVKAKDGGGNVGAEATASFTVTAPPAAPSPAAAALNAPRVVRVTWTDVGTETLYNLQRCTYSSRGCTFANVATNLPANTTSFDDAIAPANPPASYMYRVQACNTTGCSAWVTTATVFVP